MTFGDGHKRKIGDSSIVLVTLAVRLQSIVTDAPGTAFHNSETVCERSPDDADGGANPATGGQRAKFSPPPAPT